MTPSWVLNLTRVAFVTSLMLVGVAGQTRSGAQDRSLRRKQEDEVARMFETLRAKDELPPLARIAHRKSLEELVCSSASLGSPVWGQNSPGAVMYKTDEPASSNQDLERIAGFKDPLDGKDGPSFIRYAVAVWPSSNRGSGRPVYWVGIQVFESAWWEFVDKTFTDDRAYGNEWKKLVRPSCRGVD
jgi:hypothetical protein